MRKIKSCENRAVFLILSGIFLLMWALNAMTPMFADDYFYVLNLQSEQPLKDFKDVLVSISGFRRMHNGRIAAHFFAQLFLLLPKYIFNAVNAAMCTLLFYVIYLYVKTGDGRRDGLLLFSAAAMVWVLLPGFGHSFLWLTGSCSYLWAVTFISVFLYPFFSSYMQRKPHREQGGAAGLAKAVLGPAFAFFVGAYSENGSFSALAVSFCFLALIYFRDRKLPAQLALRFAAACCGFLYLMLAPTELGRKNSTGSEGMLPQLKALIDLAAGNAAVLALAAVAMIALLCWALRFHKRTLCKTMICLSAAAMVALSVLLIPDELRSAGSLPGKINAFLSETKISLVLMFGIYFCLLMAAVLLKAEKKLVMAALVLGIGAAASVAVFIAAIYFPARGVCAATVYTTAASLLLLSGICGRLSEKPLKIYAAVMLALFVPALISGCIDIKSVYDQYRIRSEVISQARSDGAEYLELEPLNAMGKYSTIWPKEAADYYYGMQAYYGIDRIIITGAEEFAEGE